MKKRQNIINLNFIYFLLLFFFCIQNFNILIKFSLKLLNIIFYKI